MSQQLSSMKIDLCDNSQQIKSVNRDTCKQIEFVTNEISKQIESVRYDTREQREKIQTVQNEMRDNFNIVIRDHVTCSDGTDVSTQTSTQTNI